MLLCENQHVIVTNLKQLNKNKNSCTVVNYPNSQNLDGVGILSSNLPNGLCQITLKIYLQIAIHISTIDQIIS